MKGMKPALQEKEALLEREMILAGAGGGL